METSLPRLIDFLKSTKGSQEGLGRILLQSVALLLVGNALGDQFSWEIVQATSVPPLGPGPILRAAPINSAR